MKPIAQKDRPTVDASGAAPPPGIEGVVVRPAVTQLDERGELTEVFSLPWGVLPEPVVHVYQVIAAPGSLRAWIVHQHQHDRLFFSLGRLKLVLFDDREDSPTRGRVEEHFFGERRRALVVIPPGVWHAVENVGAGDALYVNLPTRVFDHGDPDKHRLPPNNDLIPYRFELRGPHRTPAQP